MFHPFVPIVKYLEIILHWFQMQSKKVLLIIKSKKKNIFDNYPDPVKNLLKMLDEQKKLIYKFETADLSPGFASDFIIGIGVATLPCLLGVYGKDVVLFDPNKISEIGIPIGLKNVRFIKQPEDIIEVLDSWSANEYKDINDEMTEIKYMPNQVDAFGDGHASQRIAGYISSLIFELKNGSGSDAAIRNANRSYSEYWGYDKVIETDKFYN